ncbi:MAG: SMC family ATPase [Leptolyngbyaceae bacterium]|nr:SMC family ATPase [Leptolyngbyaceae bacterium]
MVPVQLCLKNFLSYRHAVLDFAGLHVACIAGANGAGKSSLLEAIPWAIWGKSRVSCEDDIIHLGELEVEVRFSFRLQDQTYRVIRSRHRQQGSGLEFQLQTESGFRSLTAKGMRATQQVIQHHIQLDYDTFLNSAYLRQGHGDEFMAKRPRERKQLLADILNLGQYDRLAEGARERSHQIKAELGLLAKTLEQMQQQLAEAVTITNQQAEVAQAIAQLRIDQEGDRTQLAQLQQQRQQYQQHQHEIELQRQRQHHLTQDCDRLQIEWQQCDQDLRAAAEILTEAEAIASHYAQWQTWQTEDEQLSSQLRIQQSLHQRHQELQQQYNLDATAIQQPLQQAHTQRDSIDQQLQTLQTILQQRDRITHAHTQLCHARQQCQHLDQLQLAIYPLHQQQQHLHQTLTRHQLRLQTRLEELQSSLATLPQQDEADQWHHDAIALTQQLEHLQQRRIYREKVRDKGTERRHFLERLHERQRELEEKLATLTTALDALEQIHDHLLPEPNAVYIAVSRSLSSHSLPTPPSPTSASSYSSIPSSSQPLTSSSTHPPTCPLCTHPLDHDHHHIVRQQYQTEKEAVLNDLWVLREQMTASEREIHVLRDEYKAVERELSHCGALLQQQGRLEVQLRQWQTDQRQIQALTAEIEALQQTLTTEDYGHDLRAQLAEVNQQIQALGYDDKNHALARGEVQQWRWADAKMAELRQAEKTKAELQRKWERLGGAIAHYNQQLQDLAHSSLRQELADLEQQQLALGYDAAYHEQIRQRIRQGQVWVGRYQQLAMAKQNHPRLQCRLAELEQTWGDRRRSLDHLIGHLAELTHGLGIAPNQDGDYTRAIQGIEQQIQARRSQLESLIVRQGKLQQQQQQLTTLQQDYGHYQTHYQQLQHQLRVHQELQKAFGKNGIQSLMIENLLPQFEAEANRILAQISRHQLHLQFVTQRANKSKRTKGLSDGWIDTLDILIADPHGTRPYETYSGGEAFRVSFALRLALARLLAQQSGTRLQLLIIDEGFGSQDQAGCDRLIAAINAIAPEFACILTITHMPHLKAVFDTRVEVMKTPTGSQLNFIGTI